MKKMVFVLILILLLHLAAKQVVTFSLPSNDKTTKCIDQISGDAYLTYLGAIELEKLNQGNTPSSDDSLTGILERFVNETNRNLLNITLGYRQCTSNDVILNVEILLNNTLALIVFDDEQFDDNFTTLIKNIPIFRVSSSDQRMKSHQHHFLIQPRIYTEINQLEQMIRRFQLNHFGLVTFENDQYGDIIDSKWVPMITEMKTCLDYVKLSLPPPSSADGQNISTEFWFSNGKRIIFLFGNKTNVRHLFKTLSNKTIRKITWIGHTAWAHSLDVNKTKINGYIENLVRPVVNSNYFQFTEGILESYQSQLKTLKLELVYSLLNTLDFITKAFEQAVEQTENTTLVLTRKIINDRFQGYQNNASQLVRLNLTSNQKYTISNPISNISDNSSSWIGNNFSLKCDPKSCGFNHKTLYGNLSTTLPQTKTYKYFCIKCESNDQSPTCQRHYEHIPYYSTSAYVIYTIVSVGILSAVTVCVIFFHFRKTPYVKASHQNMSLIQLFAHLLLFLAPLMFFGTPSEGLCTARPIAFGILFTFIMAMTLTKTQKLNFIFQARIRVSKRKIQMSQKMEVSLILLMMFVQMCIAGLSYLMSSSRVLIISQKAEKGTLDNEASYIIKCNTDEEFVIQLIFGFLLSLMCIIQAFKARNLPENFNETKLIFINMFLCDIAVCVCLSIRFTSSENQTRILADVLLLLSMNFILLITMYGHKCWIIIFRPELNTTSAFKENIKQHNLRGMVPDHVTMNHRDSTFSGITSISTTPDLRTTILRHGVDNLSYNNN